MYFGCSGNISGRFLARPGNSPTPSRSSGPAPGARVQGLVCVSVSTQSLFSRLDVFDGINLIMTSSEKYADVERAGEQHPDFTKAVEVLFRTYRKLGIAFEAGRDGLPESIKTYSVAFEKGFMDIHMPAVQAQLMNGTVLALRLAASSLAVKTSELDQIKGGASAGQHWTHDMPANSDLMEHFKTSLNRVDFTNMSTLKVTIEQVLKTSQRSRFPQYCLLLDRELPDSSPGDLRQFGTSRPGLRSSGSGP